MKEKAYSLEGKVSSELQRYRRDQHRYAKRPFKVVKIEKLFKAIDRASVVYLGDFHSFDQSSRNLERILRRLTSEDHSLGLGIEFVQQEDQDIINHYLAGFITEMEFLEMVNYHDSWRFPWTHYKVFFELAKKKKLTILALNTTGSLKERDKNAAKKIDHFLQENPNTTLLVLFGEYHISPNKIPSLVQEKVKQVIIHQNLDTVYFKLLEQGNPGAKTIVQFNEQEFSLQSSVPWVKYESMIYWYENLCEDPDFDLHEYIMETGTIKFNSNVPENFIYLVEKIAQALGIRVDSCDIEDFNLYDHHQLKYILRKIERVKNPTLKKFYNRLVKHGNSFILPFGNTYYCSSYSINRISFLAGMHLHHINLNSSKTHLDILISKSQIHKFIFLLFQNTLAYISSKIINPYRKCDLFLDIVHPDADAKNFLAAKLLKDLKANRKPDNSLRGQNLFNIFIGAKKIGYMLGDIIYDEFYSKSHNDFNLIKDILTGQNYEAGELKELMNIIKRKVELDQTKKRLF